MCPSLEAVEFFLAEQVAIIVSANEILNAGENIEAVIDRHNAFTLMTYCAVTIGTCHRPTHGGIPDLFAIDTSRGLVSIVDKGIAKARLGVAAAGAVLQLKACLDYVDTFEFDKYFEVRPELKLFFIRPDRQFVDVGPATLKQQSLPFVANFARHLLKTVFSEWCESGDERVSHEWISALLGHFIEGEEPFGPHSGFDYIGFAGSMRSALDSLLIKLRFHPIDILGRRITVHAPQVQRFFESSKT
jgi:hypothetical protein